MSCLQGAQTGSRWKSVFGGPNCARCYPPGHVTLARAQTALRRKQARKKNLPFRPPPPHPSTSSIRRKHAASIGWLSRKLGTSGSDEVWASTRSLRTDEDAARASSHPFFRRTSTDHKAAATSVDAVERPSYTT
ncbi:hypothetical protein MRX96_008952 [Rhipicephalus microplus]